MGEVTRTPPAERLLNLVIALVNTSTAMSKQQIRTSVAGYDQAPSIEAFERMFERDKDTLRDLGVPIVTVDPGGHADEIGYRVDQDAYALGALDLTPAELGVLSLAAQLWQDRSIATDTSRALTKIRAADVAEAATDIVAGLAPRVSAAGGALGPLLDAIGTATPVRFGYHAANTGETAQRHVEPWRVAARGGGWYLIGHDRERQAPRSYRLSRMVGSVRLAGAAGEYMVPADVDVDAFLSTAGGPEQVARLAVLPERAGAVRARGTVGVTVRGHAPGSTTPMEAEAEVRDVVEVPYGQLSAMADEIAGYGAAVVVLGPTELREAVLERLRAAARLGADRG